jgi:hypothetical protein
LTYLSLNVRLFSFGGWSKMKKYIVLICIIFSAGVVISAPANWQLGLDNIQESRVGSEVVQKTTELQLLQETSDTLDYLNHIRFVVLISRGLSVINKQATTPLSRSFDVPDVPEYARSSLAIFVNYIGEPGYTVFPAYKSKDRLTRAQAAEVLYHLMYLDKNLIVPIIPQISDIDAHLARAQIEAVVALGVMDLYKNNEGKTVFNPTGFVTKQEANVMILRATSLKDNYSLPKSTETLAKPAESLPKYSDVFLKHPDPFAGSDYVLKGTGRSGFAFVGSVGQSGFESSSLRYDFGNGYMIHLGAQYSAELDRTAQAFGELRIGYFGIRTDLGMGLVSTFTMEKKLHESISLGLGIDLVNYEEGRASGTVEVMNNIKINVIIPL